MRRERSRWTARLLLIGTAGFAILGQYYLTQRREYVWDGIIFFSIALILFTRLTRVVTRPFRQEHWKVVANRSNWARRLFHQPRSIAISLAVLLNLIAARSANTQPAPSDFTLPSILWLVSLVLIPAIFVDRTSLSGRVIRNWLDRLRQDRQFVAELALVVGLVLIGLLIRAWDLAHVPANFSGDEGTQGMWAVDVLEGRLRNPFATGWFSVPTMSFFAQAASLRLFGDSVAGLRTLSALIGTATLVITYLLARRSLGRRVALFGLSVLTFNHFHIHFSRLASNQIADPLFMSLTLWLFTEGIRCKVDRRAHPPPGTHPGGDSALVPANSSARRGLQEGGAEHWFLAAGLALGLSWYGYFGSRVILVCVATVSLLQRLVDRGFLHRYRRELLLMALMAFMVVSPLLLYYANFPENLTARFNQVSFFKWLENELDRPSHDSTLNLIVRQVWRSISAFNHTLDPTFWYRAQIPLLDFVSGALFVLGLAVGFSQLRRPGVRLILIWFVLAITFGWILTENPPSSMRMVIVAPAVALLTALGLDRLLILAQATMREQRIDWNRIGLAVLSLAAFLNIIYYFLIYTPTRVYGNPSAETATVLARYLKERWIAETEPTPGGVSELEARPFVVYFYGPPFLYYDFGTISFIARDVPGVSVPPRDQDPDFDPVVSGPTLFVFLRERLDELPMIQARYPDGSLEEFHSTADYRLMFTIYQVGR